MGDSTPDISSQLGSLSGYASDVSDIAAEQATYGSDVLPTALAQYQAGASGQLTPAQQAQATSALNQANVGTSAAYGNLGLGNSTMKSQDLAANQLQNLAEQGNLEAQSEELGLAGLQTGNQLLSGATSSYGTAGNLTQDQVTDMLNQASQSKSSQGAGINNVSSLVSALGL